MTDPIDDLEQDAAPDVRNDPIPEDDPEEEATIPEVPHG